MRSFSLDQPTPLPLCPRCVLSTVIFWKKNGCMYGVHSIPSLLTFKRLVDRALCGIAFSYHLYLLPYLIIDIVQLRSTIDGYHRAAK